MCPWRVRERHLQARARTFRSATRRSDWPGAPSRGTGGVPGRKPNRYPNSVCAGGSGADDGNRTRVFSLGSRFGPSDRVHSWLPGFKLRGPELPSGLRGFVHQDPCDSTAVSGGLTGEFRGSCVTLVSPPPRGRDPADHPAISGRARPGSWLSGQLRGPTRARYRTRVPQRGVPWGARQWLIFQPSRFKEARVPRGSE